MDAKLSKTVSKVLGLIVLVAIMFAAVVTPVAAQSSLPEVSQNSCNAYAEEHGNVAMWDDPEWQACFIAGYVNAVFTGHVDQSGVLVTNMPDELPVSIQEALDKGMYLQLTEPWAGGCDNTIEHPRCSIGFLKMFNDLGSLKTFLVKGEITQKDITKVAPPWTDGSIWMTSDFVQVSEGKTMSEADADLFCNGNLGLAFAFDGEYPLPEKDPCASNGKQNVYFLRERWNGGCIGDQLPNSSCNVGEVLILKTWDEVLKNSEGSDWLRGSVFANHRRLMQMEGIVVSTPTPLPTSTPQASPTAKVSPTAKPSNTPTPCPTQNAKGWPLIEDQSQKGGCIYAEYVSTPTATSAPSYPTATPNTGGGILSGSFPWWTWGCLLPLLIAVILIVVFWKAIKGLFNRGRTRYTTWREARRTTPPAAADAVVIEGEAHDPV